MKRKDCLVLPWRTPRVVQKFCLHKTALHSCTSVVIAYCWVLFAIVKITDWNFNKILQSCDVSGCPNGVVACAVLKKQTWLSTGCCKTNPYAGTGLVPCLCASIQNGKKKKKTACVLATPTTWATLAMCPCNQCYTATSVGGHAVKAGNIRHSGGDLKFCVDHK